MGNPNCYSYALGTLDYLSPPYYNGQAKPGSTAKLMNVFLDDRLIGWEYMYKVLHGVWADLRAFDVPDNQITPLRWEENTAVPAPGVNQRVIAMIYHELRVGWHFYRKDGDTWRFITGADNTKKTIAEADLLAHEWGFFADARWKRGYFITIPNNGYGPLRARQKEWWVP